MGNPKTEREKRRHLRRKLEKQGFNSDQVESIVADNLILGRTMSKLNGKTHYEHLSEDNMNGEW